MAFVTVSERKITDVGQKELFPSPAHYTLDTSSNSHECAPFRSTSVRKIQFDQKQSMNMPGPGQYDLSRPIVTPNISSYLCQQNVIFKVNSNGSYPFQSSTKRFDYSVQNTPGPASYQSAESQLIIKKYTKKLPKQKMANQLVANPSIPARARGLLSILQRQKVRLEPSIPGPGSYEDQNKKHINSKGVIWAKDKVKRFMPDEKTNVGPGKYVLQGRHKKNNYEESSVFKSNTVRSFFDTLIYGSQVQEVAKYRQLNRLKSQSPAPGQYNNEPSSFVSNLTKPLQFQHLGSSVQRFPEQKMPQSNAFYDVHQVNGKKSHNKLKMPFDSSTKRDDCFLGRINGQQSVPGPGYYLRLSQLKQRKKGKQIEQFGSTTERLPEKTIQQIQLGPGQYNTGQTVHQIILKNRFGQLNTQNGIFKSKTRRDCFENTSSLPRIGQYDVGYNDVAKKLERQNNYLENLRRINVFKPPFQSSDTRFRHYQQWDEPGRPVNPEKHNQKSNQKNNQKSNQKKRKQREVSIPKPIPGHTFGNLKRFQEKRIGNGSPGVGAYQYHQEWNIKSHNTRFNHT